MIPLTEPRWEVATAVPFLPSESWGSEASPLVQGHISGKRRSRNPHCGINCDRILGKPLTLFIFSMLAAPFGDPFFSWFPHTMVSSFFSHFSDHSLFFFPEPSSLNVGMCQALCSACPPHSALCLFTLWHSQWGPDSQLSTYVPIPASPSGHS